MLTKPLLGVLGLVVLPAGTLAAPASSTAPADRTAAYYEEVVRGILTAAQQNRRVWERLVYLGDRIGARPAGSAALEAATVWAAEEMRGDGLANVRLQPVEVPHWVRGEEWGRIVAPVTRPLHLLGLGGSVGTGGAVLRADLLVVESFDELERLPAAEIRGKIVLYNVPWQGYGRTVRYRTSGASRAAARGAAAVLLRSVTPVSLQSPHTGQLVYAEDAPRIPAAAVTLEDAALLARLAAGGEKVTVELYMEAENRPPALSANVLGEVPGRERPEEIVVLGAHIDSWDVGQGAHDDGAGVAVCLEAAALLNRLAEKPRRTIRVVLFTNEEHGLSGAHAYRRWIGPDIDRHVAAIEMDAGAEKPVGFGFSWRGVSDVRTKRTLERLESLARLLAPVEADRVSIGGGGADISPLMADGVPGFGLRTVGEKYFWWHHTEADTVDKVNPEDLRAALGAVTAWAYLLAEVPDLFEGRTPSR